MRMKTFAAGLSALAWLAISAPAGAADLLPHKAPPRPVAYNWTGFYVGLNGGYGWGTSNWDHPVFSGDPSGWMIGITGGYNMQINNIVLGLEGDYDWADINASGGCHVDQTCTVKSTYLATLRGRIGLAFDRFLPYLTGGAAFGKVGALTPGLGYAITINRTGWTFGGGVEYAFTGRWSAKLEYLYVDFGSFDSLFLAPVVENISYTENVFRFGLNYKFSALPLMSRY